VRQIVVPRTPLSISAARNDPMMPMETVKWSTQRALDRLPKERILKKAV
jgi:hypothetical protein